MIALWLILTVEHYFIFFCLCTLRAYVRSYNKAITYLFTYSNDSAGPHNQLSSRSSLKRSASNFFHSLLWWPRDRFFETRLVNDQRTDQMVSPRWLASEGLLLKLQDPKCCHTVQLAQSCVDKIWKIAAARVISFCVDHLQHPSEIFS